MTDFLSSETEFLRFSKRKLKLFISSQTHFYPTARFKFSETEPVMVHQVSYMQNLPCFV